MARTGDSEPSMEDILASIRRIITDDVPPLAPEPVAVSAVAEADVLELTEPMAEAAPEPPGASAPAVTADSLSALIVRDYPGADRTLEALVGELLKPMLREWLDAHLPGMVERMVSGEVKRISGRA